MPRETPSVSSLAGEISAANNPIKSNSGNSLSLSLDSSSERKRRLAMPNRTSSRSSPSDTCVPAVKLGKSLSGNSVNDPSIAQIHSSSSPRGDSAASSGYISAESETPPGEGLMKYFTRKHHHECTAIITDGVNDNSKPVICKVRCPLGDPWAHRYPPVPFCNKSTVTIGKNCVDMSLKELSTHGIKCIEHLYRGTFSNIFVGYDETSHQYVAVKVTNMGDHSCKRELRNFSPCFETKHNSEEIDHLRQFKHCNIISLLNCFDTRTGKKAIVLEFCQSGRLSRILEKTKLMSEAVASRFFHQMFDAVHFIHSRSHVVRNVALTHFLLTDSNRIKLIDLSSVCAMDRVTNNHNIGVPGYQAPETVKPFPNMKYPDRADLWSLGACLYSMLTGTITTVHHSQAASYKDAFVYPDHMTHLLSSSVLELLAGILEYLPEYRFSSVRVEYSDWYKEARYAPITGGYLLRQTHKFKLSKHELATRDYMEL